jgi:hypothetical protein
VRKPAEAEVVDRFKGRAELVWENGGGDGVEALARRQSGRGMLYRGIRPAGRANTVHCQGERQLAQAEIVHAVACAP